MNLKITPESLESALKSAGHKMFKTDKKDYNLNIVGIRSIKPTVNEFNDLIVVAWKHNGKWTIKEYVATTLAGVKWLKQPMNPKGCAILKEGRYDKTWKIAMHRNSYAALCQIRPVKVYRDNNKDSNYDMWENSVQEGNFGINIHRASAFNVLNKIDLHSAGCQVFQNPKDFNEFIDICRNSQRLWGDWFTYTLINESHFIVETHEKNKVTSKPKTDPKKKAVKKGK